MLFKHLQPRGRRKTVHYYYKAQVQQFKRNIRFLRRNKHPANLVALETDANYLLGLVPEPEPATPARSLARRIDVLPLMDRELVEGLMDLLERRRGREAAAGFKP